MHSRTDGTRRVVVVTGANEGIGFNLLRSLVDDGYRVVGVDVAGSNLRPLQERFPDQVRYSECDLTVDDDVTETVEAILDDWGRIDILVNNAAVFHYGAFTDQSIEQTREEFEVNYFGYVRMLRAVLPHMLARNEGLVHNVSSGVAAVGHPGMSGYASTKGAIEALVRSVRSELRHTDVACTLLYPPLTNTRSAAELGYPDSLLSDPEVVGRKLADRIESTGPRVWADWQTRVGMAVVELFPALAKVGTARFVDADPPVEASKTE
jgi:NAD(P)-dependent dehydrogenase (short-subunit alcohol dehydrogenase family)